MRAIAPIVLAAFWLVLALPARAIPVLVDFSIFEDFHTWVGTGSFTFDSDYFYDSGSVWHQDGYGYCCTGLVPMDELEDAGVTFFGGALAGTHWSLSDVHLGAWDLNPITPGWLGLPQWNWWWWTTAEGHTITGPDGIGSLYADNGHDYTVYWDGRAVPEEEDASIPEPPPLALCGLGFLVTGWMARGRRSRVRGA